MYLDSQLNVVKNLLSEKGNGFVVVHNTAEIAQWQQTLIKQQLHVCTFGTNHP